MYHNTLNKYLQTFVPQRESIPTHHWGQCFVRLFRKIRRIFSSELFLSTLVWVSCGITCVVADLMHRKHGAVTEKWRSGGWQCGFYCEKMINYLVGWLWNYLTLDKIYSLHVAAQVHLWRQYNNLEDNSWRLLTAISLTWAKNIMSTLTLNFVKLINI